MSPVKSVLFKNFLNQITRRIQNKILENNADSTQYASLLEAIAQARDHDSLEEGLKNLLGLFNNLAELNQNLYEPLLSQSDFQVFARVLTYLAFEEQPDIKQGFSRELGAQFGKLTLNPFFELTNIGMSIRFANMDTAVEFQQTLSLLGLTAMLNAVKASPVPGFENHTYTITVPHRHVELLFGLANYAFLTTHSYCGQLYQNKETFKDRVATELTPSKSNLIRYLILQNQFLLASFDAKDPELLSALQPLSDLLISPPSSWPEDDSTIRLAYALYNRISTIYLPLDRMPAFYTDYVLTLAGIFSSSLDQSIFALSPTPTCLAKSPEDSITAAANTLHDKLQKTLERLPQLNVSLYFDSSVTSHIQFSKETMEALVTVLNALKEDGYTTKNCHTLSRFLSLSPEQNIKHIITLIKLSTHSTLATELAQSERFRAARGFNLIEHDEIHEKINELFLILKTIELFLHRPEKLADTFEDSFCRFLNNFDCSTPSVLAQTVGLKKYAQVKIEGLEIDAQFNELLAKIFKPLGIIVIEKENKALLIPHSEFEKIALLIGYPREAVFNCLEELYESKQLDKNACLRAALYLNNPERLKQDAYYLEQQLRKLLDKNLDLQQPIDALLTHKDPSLKKHVDNMIQFLMGFSSINENPSFIDSLCILSTLPFVGNNHADTSKILENHFGQLCHNSLFIQLESSGLKFYCSEADCERLFALFTDYGFEVSRELAFAPTKPGLENHCFVIHFPHADIEELLRVAQFDPKLIDPALEDLYRANQLSRADTITKKSIEDNQTTARQSDSLHSFDLPEIALPEQISQQSSVVEMPTMQVSAPSISLSTPPGSSSVSSSSSASTPVASIAAPPPPKAKPALAPLPPFVPAATTSPSVSSSASSASASIPPIKPEEKTVDEKHADFKQAFFALIQRCVNQYLNPSEQNSSGCQAACRSPSSFFDALRYPQGEEGNVRAHRIVKEINQQSTSLACWNVLLYLFEKDDGNYGPGSLKTGILRALSNGYSSSTQTPFDFKKFNAMSKKKKQEHAVAFIKELRIKTTRYYPVILSDVYFTRLPDEEMLKLGKRK